MTDYEWLKQMGLCQRCRKEKVAPGHVHCFDCLAKIRGESAQRYATVQRKEYNEEYRQRRREIYQEKKASGICIRCDKPATHGMYCYEHFIEQRRRSMKRAESAKWKRHERGLIPDERKEKGLCRWCGEKALPGLQCCEKHQEMCSLAGKKAREKDEAVNGYWRLQEQKRLNYISGMKNGQNTR